MCWISRPKNHGTGLNFSGGYPVDVRLSVSARPRCDLRRHRACYCRVVEAIQRTWLAGQEITVYVIVNTLGFSHWFSASGVRTVGMPSTPIKGERQPWLYKIIFLFRISFGLKALLMHDEFALWLKSDGSVLSRRIAPVVILLSSMYLY
jgi:hypothetical protein